MAEALMKYETLDALQIDDIMAGLPPRPPEGWSDVTTTPLGVVAGTSAGGKDSSPIRTPAGQH
jgi:cell division protease FtsH